MRRGDFCDQAAHTESLFLAGALCQQRKASTTPQQSAFECQCCGTPIPQARREAITGVQTCIDCQADQELRKKTCG